MPCHGASLVGGNATDLRPFVYAIVVGEAVAALPSVVLTSDPDDIEACVDAAGPDPTRGPIPSISRDRGSAEIKPAVGVNSALPATNHCCSDAPESQDIQLACELGMLQTARRLDRHRNRSDSSSGPGGGMGSWHDGSAPFRRPASLAAG